jgi:hypothetical protein
LTTMYFSSLRGAPLRDMLAVHDKGEPVARRGRKATGLY